MLWEDGAQFLDRHKFTSNEGMPYRCLEAIYIVTLLEYGFGFHGTHRNLTLALEIDGVEVEWTLGYALATLMGQKGSIVDQDSWRKFVNHISLV